MFFCRGSNRSDPFCHCERSEAIFGVDGKRRFGLLRRVLLAMTEKKEAERLREEGFGLGGC
jgi:hypothetical protein